MRALTTIALVAVAREGFETALFLLSAESSSASGVQVVISGLIGLAISAVVGIYLYRIGNRVNLKSFSMATGIMLILFAGGWLARPYTNSADYSGLKVAS